MQRAYWLLPEPVVDGAGFGATGAGAWGALDPVVAAGGAGTLLAVVSFTGPRVNTNISTNARTTAPATQPHMALEDSSSFMRCERISSSCSGGGS
jgi:hypothetical protein